MKRILLAAGLTFATVSSFAQLPKDPATYAPAEGYQIESLWMQCSKLGNKPADINGSARGMAVLNGKIYVTMRRTVKEGEASFNNGSLLIYDAQTGAFEKELQLTGDDVSHTGILTTNDVQVDDAGNLIVCSLCTNMSSENDPFSVWIVNPETGVCKNILKYTNIFADTYRIDCFGVYGDITKDGFLMAAISKDETVGGTKVFRWNFVNGAFPADADAQIVEIKEYASGSALELGNSDAPRVTPIDTENFYLDPQTGWATLYNMNGEIVEGFNTAELKDFQPENGGGNNGVDEFSYNGDDFVVYVISNTAHPTYPQAWNICKLGEGMTFAGMKKIARIPDGGLGTESNGVRTALPRIEVKDDGAHIYVFATNGGMAAYKMSAVSAGIGSSYEEGAVSIINGTVVMKEAASVEVYTVAGQRVASAAGVTSLMMPEASGLYIVKVTLANNKQVVLKALVD